MFNLRGNNVICTITDEKDVSVEFSFTPGM